MRTEVMHEPTTGTPYLEHESPSGSIEKTPLETFPFKIGRGENADLRIDSSQVSREHAVITRHGKKFRVRDSNSTNGTTLNGQRIEESPINDGDQLVIADVEFTFCCPAPEAARQMATEVMPLAQRPVRDTTWDTIFAVRRIHEVVTRRGLATLFQPVVELASGDTFGYEAFATSGAGDPGHPRCEQWAGAIECRGTDRMRQLFRRLAAEEARALPGGRLLLAVAAAETANPTLLDHLCYVQELVGKTRQLIVEIPDSAVRSTADFRQLLANLREAQIQVAYDGYASGKAQITEHKDITPDYLKLAPSILRSIHRGKERQRQVQLIVRASHDAGSAVIAAGIDNDADLSVCREMGCTFAQGELFGDPQPASAIEEPLRRQIRAGQLVH